jgi:hypothetical protein
MMSRQGIGFLFCFTLDRFSVSFFMTASVRGLMPPYAATVAAPGAGISRPG